MNNAGWVSLCNNYTELHREPQRDTEKDYFLIPKNVLKRPYRKMRVFCCLIVLICCNIACYAQIEGYVSDSKDGERLPFTHVFNLNTSKGVSTDINGFYRIEAQKGDTLQFSYVGYFIRKITVDEAQQINVKLNPTQIALNEVVVRPGENPAHRIVNNAIANREINNPENRNSYSCMIYNKLILDVTKSPLQDSLDSETVLINETTLERHYKYKGNVKEHIIASRTSGFNAYQQLAFLPSLLQMFHFYQDVLEWKATEKFFLNPISPGSTSKYFFLLQDTIISGVDTTFIISYQPRRATNFEGLKGLLYINSKGWAIQSVVAEPADYSPVRLKIQQNYEMIDSVWFPAELSFELFLDNIKGINFVYRGKSHIREVDLTSDPANMTFKGRNITIADNANKRMELIDHYRYAELSPQEDSTFRKYKDGYFDFIYRITEGLTDNSAITLKKIDFPLERIILQNYSEGFRIGLGAYTNRHLSPWFSVGGYFGYGTGDRQNKYGASFSLYPEKHLDSEIILWRESDLYSLTFSKETGIAARKRWDRLDIAALFKMQDIQTAFDYSFTGQDMSVAWHRNAEARIGFRYAHNEERAKLYRRSIPLFTTRFPVFFFNVRLGIANIHYIKAEAGVERCWYIRNLGTATFSLRGGWINKELPFPLLFTVTDTEQSLFLTTAANWRTSFNVLTNNLYASNQYFNTFLYHDFGTLLGKTNSKVFRPRIAIAQSFGWSKLNRPADHVSAQYQILDMHKGYFESGIVVEDILRLEIYKLFFFNIGGGVYAAYGGSVQKPFEKTLTPKIRLAASF